MKSSTFDFTLSPMRPHYVILYPWSVRADRWIAEHLATWEKWADGLVFEDRHVPILMDALQGAGFVINL